MGMLHSLEYRKRFQRVDDSRGPTWQLRLYSGGPFLQGVVCFQRSDVRYLVEISARFLLGRLAQWNSLACARHRFDRDHLSHCEFRKILWPRCRVEALWTFRKCESEA